MRLDDYDQRGYQPGAGLLRRVVWYLLNALLFDSWLLPSSTIKVKILRLFGAKIGNNVVIKPRVNIKYPWFLSIGDSVWIGESVWLDNLDWIKIKSNVCISQGAYLLTGNHDYKDPCFGLIISQINVEDHAWLGANSVICPGVMVGRGAVITAACVLKKSAVEYGVYEGNPAQYVRVRKLVP